MSQVANRPLTFEEFAALPNKGRVELVNGQLEEMVAARPLHGKVVWRLSVMMDPYLEEHFPDGYWGTDVDVPTIAFHGRRPDLLVYTEDAARRGVDLVRNQVRNVPTLAIEIISPDDEERDTVVKRPEYAEAGVAHYWIVDPERQTAVTLVLRGDHYEVAGEFDHADVLVSDLFPGLEIPLRRLFR